jgi:uncharacterized membrane protein required for colicin V production
MPVLDQLPISVFDLVFITMVVLGICQGRKHGMSEELMPLLTWAAIVICCGLLYEPAGRLLMTCSPDLLKATDTFGMLTWYIAGYFLIAIGVLSLSAWVNQRVGGKLLGSDVFGDYEYYLGMGAGALRFSCIVVVAMALLNACYVSPIQVQARERYQQDNFGSLRLPGVYSVQQHVFKQSTFGSWIKEHAGMLLIRRTAPNQHGPGLKDADLPD